MITVRRNCAGGRTCASPWSKTVIAVRQNGGWRGTNASRRSWAG